MNTTKQVLENRTVRLLSPKFRIEYNKFKINKHNSPEHEGLKKRILNWLIKQGYSVVCEAIFKSGKRADLLVLNPALAIEVQVSETDEKLATKNYPVKILGVKSIKEVKNYFLVTTKDLNS